jgi:iron complex outermembrane receptor protein
LETKLELSFHRQYNLRQEFDNSIFSSDGADLRYELTTHTGELRIDHRFSTVFKTELGITGQRQANTYTGRFFIPNFLAYEGGAYLIQHLTFEHQELELGVRYDVRQQEAFMYRMDTLYSPERSFSGLSWNLGYGIEKGAWSFSTNLAQGWRPPAINELYSNGLHHGAAAVEVGDELLDEERVFSWMNQFEVRDLYYGGLRWSLMLRGHVSYYDQFIYLVPTGTPALTIRGAYPTFSYRGVDALLTGIDASLGARFGGRWSGVLGVEMVRGQEWSNSSPLIFMPADRADLELRYALDLFKEGRYISVTATGVNEQFRVPGIDYAPPPPAYFLLASELGWTFSLGSSVRVITALRVSNILNTSYRSYTNRLRYFADEMGRNFSLVIRVPFDFSPKQEQIRIIQK